METVNKSVTTKVSRERWEQAQAWERQHWVNTQKNMGKFGKNLIWKMLAAFNIKDKYRGNDWNYWWQQQFDNYDFLPEQMNNMIELGCGPYSNTRLILEKTTPKHVVLSDPLIKTYVNFNNTFVAGMYREGFCTIDDHPIEECPFRSDFFDLSIMINVLDHVKDADLCMQNAMKIVKPGGIFIFGQDLSNDEDMQRRADKPEDIGHPIFLDEEWCNLYLDAGFEPIIRKVLSREEGRNPKGHYATMIFAGRKVVSK